MAPAQQRRGIGGALIRHGLDVVRQERPAEPLVFLEGDPAFYARFEEILGRYPRTDLERDFINVIVRPRPA